MTPDRAANAPSMSPAPGSPPVEWLISSTLVPYEQAVARMEARAEAIAAGAAREQVWLLEHPPIYTAGSSAKDADLLDPRFPVYRSGRGGQYTYHGPGQRVAYVMLDLSRRRRDVRAFVCALEGWLIAALGDLGVRAERRANRVGVWVARPDKPRGPALRAGRRQDRGARRALAPLGEFPRRRAECRSGSVAFFRHRALRPSRRAIWRDQPRRAWRAERDADRRRGVAPSFRGFLRSDGRRRTMSPRALSSPFAHSENPRAPCLLRAARPYRAATNSFR